MLGCSLYEILTLRKPFTESNFFSLIRNIINKPIDFDIVPSIYSEGLKRILRRLLIKDQNARPSIEDILSDDYFTASKLKSCLTTGSTKRKSLKLSTPSHNDFVVENRNKLKRNILLNSKQNIFQNSVRNCNYSMKLKSASKIHVLNSSRNKEHTFDFNQIEDNVKLIQSLKLGNKKNKFTNEKLIESNLKDFREDYTSKYSKLKNPNHRGKFSVDYFQVSPINFKSKAFGFNESLMKFKLEAPAKATSRIDTLKKKRTHSWNLSVNPVEFNSCSPLRSKADKFSPHDLSTLNVSPATKSIKNSHLANRRKQILIDMSISNNENKIEIENYREWNSHTISLDKP